MKQPLKHLIIEDNKYISLRFFPEWNLFTTRQIHGLMHMLDDVQTKAKHKSTWVELGSFAGESAAIILGYRFIKKLHCVDKRIYKTLQRRTSEAVADGRCELHEMLSEAAREKITDFDVVYIDADHTYEAVKLDIAAWYPGIPSGGVLCGHDYTPGVWNGVVQAVDEFCAANNYTITRYIDSSWMIIKR